MTPSRLASAISRTAVASALEEVKRHDKYRERHDAAVKRLNRLMRPAKGEM